jgi:subtilisin family serine protease
MNDNVLSQLGLVSATALYSGSTWYTVELKADADTAETVTYLRELGCFEKVDYDYIMGVTADMESVDVSSNPNAAGQTNLGVHKIPEGWEEVKTNGKHPGGSPDVIVAVIDTGVDYNHLDLRNNIWVNPAEIPDNGKDDDGNGYVDDVYGWDCVGNDKDPMDDNGHGTHVAGIIAAENNTIGGVGVAYNCKIMVLKAGNSSGYFNNSDIAEAVQYAYMNGASVINMSFGGSNISIAVEEALENAYNTSILVAAAGNDSACNNLACLLCLSKKVSYPAALPYVIGVMSTDKNGSGISSFSNYDHYPYNSIEYEVYAVGEAVNSTWPNNRYASLNGTSMAAPTVAGIAALLRSRYADREVYSTKFIQSQIVNTGTINLDGAHTVADAQAALTKLPKPSVNLYDYYIDDSVSIGNKNNGNGVIDAGETVRLYISLHNRGGVASNVNVSIDTYRSTIGDETLTDPYFTFVNTTLKLSDIGTYSVRECYEDQYFEIIVSSDCPNDYLVDFNIRFTYTNGLDEKDTKTYSGAGKAQFNVSRGFHLPATITEDTVYTADRLYIVGQDVVISEGITVTFEEGCEIQFFDDREYYNSPRIVVYGTLLLNGSKDNMIKTYPNERHSNFWCCIENNGDLAFDYVETINLLTEDKSNNAGSIIRNSYLKLQTPSNGSSIIQYSNGTLISPGGFKVDIVLGSYIEIVAYNAGFDCTDMKSNFLVVTHNSNIDMNCNGDFADNIVYGEWGPNSYRAADLNCKNVVTNNVFCSYSSSVKHLTGLSFKKYDSVSDNYFSPLYQKYASQVITNYYDSTGTPTVDVYGSLADASLLWPHVVSVEMFDKDGNPITTVGREEIKVRVTFNRAMDTTQNTFLTFGTIEPYADYRINGEWVSDTVWEGSYSLKAQIENGQNFLKVNNACAAEDPTKVVFGEYHLYEFTIDTTEAMSMNLQAFPQENGILLNFVQDDYDTLLGYNIYRAESKDGNYVKLNPAILLPTESTFLDENAEPGKTYWYTYTVVLTDFTESNPAGKVVATAMDTLTPNLYHTPVNQGYENNNLVITCTATDNVAISTVTLYYRAVGATEWKALNMAKQSDKYSATIFGSDVTLAGLEYYIVASDGRNTINKGSADAPYTVVVKDASTLSRKGDVDGDGVVTAKDALMLMRCLEGSLILSDDEFKRADLNGDGVLSAAEALRILQYVNGKVNTLEM